MKTVHIFRNLWISLILVIGLLLMSASAIAAANPIDVILLLDSSGSMKKTDPQFLRKPAAKLFISLLGEEDRVSVVSFSDNGYPVSYLASAKKPRSQKRHFAAVDKISTKGVYTNLTAAIETALNVYRRNPKANRQLHVVLMTDGEIDMGSAKKNRALRKELLKGIAPKLAKQGIKLHSIAFTNKSDIDLLKQLAEKTDGNFYLAKTDKELHGVYTAIFENTKTPSQVAFNGGKFVIDRSISEATIIGSKSGNKPLSLRSPDGKRFTSQSAPSSVKWMETTQFDLITIKTPKPGEWRLLSSDGHDKAYVITDLQLKTAFEPNHPDVGAGVMIKAWLEEKSHKLKKKEILSNLSVNINVLTPQGETHHLAMEPYANHDASKDSDGIFASYIVFPSKGNFKLNIQFDGKTFSRKSQLLVAVGMPATSSANTPLEHAVADAIMQAAKQEEKQDAPAPKDMPRGNIRIPNDAEASSPLMTAVFFFIGINMLLALVGGGAYWFMQRKKRAQNSDEDESANDDMGARDGRKEPQFYSKAA